MKKITKSTLVMILCLLSSGVAYSETCIQWTRVADLQEGNQMLGAAVLNGKIYAVGGHRGYGGYLSEAQVYDPATDQWQWIASMNTPRTYPAVVSYNNQIYAMNGTCCGGSVPLNSTEIYDPQGNSWNMGKPMDKYSESMNAAVELDGKIYVVGGFGGIYYGECQNFLMMWNGEEWVELIPSPSPLRFASHAVTVANGKIYAIGGGNCTDTNYSRTFVYDPSKNEWENGPPLNIPRLYHTAVTLGDKIFVMGGEIFTNNTYISIDSVEVLDLSNPNATWQISECSKLSFPRDFHASVVLNNEIYVLGGRQTDGQQYTISWSPVVEKGTLFSPNQCPVANAGSNITITSEEQIATTIQGTTSDSDNNSLICRWLEGETILSNWQSVGPNGECLLDLGPLPDFSSGEHILKLEVSDGKCISKDEMILTVTNSAPYPAPSGGGVCEINAQFTLTGQVFDYDGDAVNYEWFEGINLLFSGSVSTIYGGTPVDLPNYSYQCLVLGDHEIILTANDGVNPTIGAIPINIKVIDTTNPILSPIPDKNILWPPNHKMVNVSIQANARDNNGGLLTISALVYSNEPQEGLGDGDMSPDWTDPVIDQTNGIIFLQLRAERSGSGNGRVYTIVITATDQSGNSSQAMVDIIVPHDQRKK